MTPVGDGSDDLVPTPPDDEDPPPWFPPMGQPCSVTPVTRIYGQDLGLVNTEAEALAGGVALRRLRAPRRSHRDQTVLRPPYGLPTVDIHYAD